MRIEKQAEEKKRQAEQNEQGQSSSCVKQEINKVCFADF